MIETINQLIDELKKIKDKNQPVRVYLHSNSAFGSIVRLAQEKDNDGFDYIDIEAGDV